MHTARSKNGIPIRLTDERWLHITIGHPEMANYYFEVLETVENPEIVYYGNLDELLAVKSLPGSPDRYLVVVDKELADHTGVLVDGFIMTAYSTSKAKSLEKRQIAWQP